MKKISNFILQKRMSEVIKHGFLVIMVLFALYPFTFMIYSSFKTQSSIEHNFWAPPVSVQEVDAKHNYTRAWTIVAPYIKNSLIVTISQVLGVVFIASMAAYAFARYNFPGKKLFFSMIIILLMIPGVLTLIASFMWVRKLFWIRGFNLIDTYWVLILPPIAGAMAGAIFLCKSFFASLPQELFEAAKIDGATDLQIIKHIVFPLSKPILGTIAIMNILASWNDFMWPLLTAGDKRLYTIAIGLRYFQGSYSTAYGPLFAGYTIASIPLIVFFLLTMRHFIAGLTSGAIKA